MVETELYCYRCHKRFNAGEASAQCPGCGELLAPWIHTPTLDLSDTRRNDGLPTESATDELVGTQLGNYWIERFLGEGGMARVYRGRHLTLERPCAIKVLRPSLAARSPDAMESLLAEARAAASLVHPHVVALHTIGHDRDYHFLEMEFVDGTSLDCLVTESGGLEATEATRLMAEISSALAQAHRLGLVHRDIKPANVMVTRERVAKVADFGLAKRLRTKAGDQDRLLAGTPHFMAPELFCGETAGPRSDVYALGVTYYCLLTADLPLRSQSLSELIQLHARPASIDYGRIVGVAGEPARLLIERCLKHDPDDRYADAIELHEEFRALYGSLRSLESLLREALRGVVADIDGSGDRFCIAFPLEGGRSQTVCVEACHGAVVVDQAVRVYSVCGPVVDDYLRRALELNAEIAHGAIAIQKIDGEPHFIMADAYPRATCDPEELRKSVITIARHADEVEQRLTGQDRH